MSAKLCEKLSNDMCDSVTSPNMKFQSDIISSFGARLVLSALQKATYGPEEGDKDGKEGDKSDGK